MKRKQILAAAVSSVVLLVAVDQSLAQLRAFAEAEGYGAYTTGGRGGEVYHVTNLNDSGAGSLRTGLTSVPAGGRTIVFDVGGWIELNSRLAVPSNVTIAGQTAPGQGIGIKNYGLSVSNATNVIVRHMRVRQGPYNDAIDKDATGGDSATNILFDHISASWGRDETMSFNSCTNVTIQNSIIAEGLYNHSMGGLIQWNNGISIHHSLYMNNNDRNPKMKGISDFVNNVVYNWGAYCYVAESAGLSYGNVVNNYFVAGPSSTELHDPISRGNANYSIFMDGNYYDGNRNGVLDGTLLTPAMVDDTLTYMPTRFSYPQVTTDTAQRAYDKVLAGVGTSISRDYTDNRLIGLVQTQTGAIITDPAQVGGWGTLTGGTAPADTDQDGMPNTWETAHGLNPNDATDRNSLNLFGYTRLEEYLNELGGGHAQKIWTASSGNWQSNPTWLTSQPTVDDNVFIRGNGGATNGNATINASAAEAWDLRIGGNGSSTTGETLTVASGGNLTVRNIMTIGYENKGMFQMTGGAAEAQYVIIGSFGQPGTLALNGGTLKTAMIANDGAGGTVQMGGGTIAALRDMTVSSPVTLNAGGGSINSNGFNATVSSVISGTGALTKTGAGMLTLGNTNTYSGGTVLASGTLSIASHGNIGGTSSAITFNGGLLQVTGTAITNISAHTVNWSTFNGGIDVADSTNTFTITNAIGGTGSFTKAGAGTLLLTAASTYSGGTTLAGGVLSAASDSYLGSASGPLNFAGGTLQLTSSATYTMARPATLANSSTIEITQLGSVVTMSQPITGAGSISKIGPGTLIFGAANTYTGQTMISAGTLRISNALALQNTTVNIAGGTLDLNGLAATIGGLAGTGTVDLKGTKLTLGGSGADSAFAGNISSSSGVGLVEKIGANAIDLTGTNTYTGGTTLSAGTLGITTDANIGGTSSAITFNGGLLRINGTTLTSPGSHTVNWTTFKGGFDIASSANTYTISSAISGTGSMTKAGAGVLTLSGANTYSGGTILKAGTLSIGAVTNVGGSGKSITFDGGLLRVTGTTLTNLTGMTVNWSTFNGGFDINSSSNTFTVSQTISGNGSFTKAGAGILVLSAANTLTGDTTLTAGTLQISNANALQNSTLVPNGGTLALSTITSANIGGIKGSGALSLTGVTINVGSNNQNGSYSGVLSSATGGVFNKVGTGILTLSGASTFGGPINVTAGILSTATFANASTNSSLGFGASAAALVIDGGVLQYNSASAATSTRLFSIGPNGGTIECAGAGKLLLQGTGAIGMTGTGDRTFTLAGVNADCELKSTVGDPSSGKTSLQKIDGGRWILSQTAAFTYSGNTIIDQGILIPLSISNILPHGTGKGNLVINEGQFELNNFNLTVNGLSGGGNINNRGKSGSTDVTRTITVGDANSTADYYGTLSNTSGLNSAAKLSIAKIGTGTQTLSGQNTYTGTTSISAGTLTITGRHNSNHDAYSVTGGTLRVATGAQISSSGTPSTLSVTGAGLANIDGGSATFSSFNATNLTIQNNGKLAIAPNGTAAAFSQVTSLVTSTGGQLNINNNAMLVRSSDTTNATRNAKWAQVVSGQNSFDNNGQVTWDGPGIVSSTARASNLGIGVDVYVIGVSSNHDLARLAADGGAAAPYDATNPWLGSVTTVAANDILIRMTYAGDTNLDGTVTIDDYNNIDGTFSGLLPSNYGWVSGDFDFSGAITIDDYNAIDTGFLYQGGQLSQAMLTQRLAQFGPAYVAHLETVAAAFASVPEPTTAGMLAIGAMGLLSRRRRKA